MARVSKCSPFQSQRQTQQQQSNTEGEKKEEEKEDEQKEERKEEPEVDDKEEEGTLTNSDEKKKEKMAMKGKKRKQKYGSINELMKVPKGKPKGIVIRDRDDAKKSDDETEQKPPAAKRKKPNIRIVVKSSYSLRSSVRINEPKGKEKEQETGVLEAKQDTDRKGKGIAEPSDHDSESTESD